ncbi:MAG: A24 family peptidase, partial [Alphaproteobacteria bacterium]
LNHLERATIHPTECEPTGLPMCQLGRTTAVVFVGLLVCAYPFAQLPLALLLAGVLARATAMDMHLRILPNIYTLPLLVGGVLAQAMAGQGLASLYGVAFAAGVVGLIAVLHYALTRTLPTWGGDMKLMLAMGAWLGVEVLPFALLMAGLLNVPLFYFFRNGTPYGLGLAFSLMFWVFQKNAVGGLLSGFFIP